MSKEFSIVEALAGKPVETRQGRKVIEVVLLGKANPDITMPLCVVFEGGEATRYNMDGKWVRNATVDHPRDLVMSAEKAECWINVFSSFDGTKYFGGTHTSLAGAQEAATRSGRNFVKTVHVVEEF